MCHDEAFLEWAMAFIQKGGARLGAGRLVVHAAGRR
jgi:hypothetical protein